MIKLGTILAAVVAFFGLFVFGPFWDKLWVQLAVLVVILGWNSVRFSPGSTVTALKSTLPFVASLLAFGALFQVIRLQGREDWLADSLVKSMLFPSTLIFLRLLLSYITYLDILTLPISMERRFQVITIKSVFDKGGRYLSRFAWYLDTYPYLHSDRTLERALQKYASLIVALYLYLYEETENAGLLLRNRYRHLRGDRP